ncbi:MAG: hypothetical protein K2X35_11145 [Bryobacteraceae bacterium]|nr:hypothetical protein [Bryobacteraceae bacterium]
MSELTRRQALILAAAAAARATPPDPLEGPRLYADLLRYSALGEHRTATEADIRTSRWLRDELRDAGFQADLHPFRLRQFFLKSAELRADGQRIDCFPLWWPRPTGSRPVSAPLVPATTRDLRGKIALLKFPEIRGASVTPASPVPGLVDGLVKAGVVGIVAVTRSLPGEIVALNAMAGLTMWPVPVLCVGQRDEAALDRAASAVLRIEGKYKADAEAFETVGRLRPNKPVILVSTPSSGWFRCAGERGPGVALWLGLARWAVRREAQAAYLFVASSGHELSGVGIRSFLDHHAPPPGDVACWLHLGAGIATYEYRKTASGLEKLATASRARRLYTRPQFESLLAKAFAGQSDLKPIVTDQPGGEMILMAQRGYPFFGFAGGSAFHHMPGDLPERITGPELLEPVARSLAMVLESIESEVAVSRR